MLITFNAWSWSGYTDDAAQFLNVFLYRSSPVILSTIVLRGEYNEKFYETGY